MWLGGGNCSNLGFAIAARIATIGPKRGEKFALNLNERWPTPANTPGSE